MTTAVYLFACVSAGMVGWTVQRRRWAEAAGLLALWAAANSLFLWLKYRAAG